MNFCIRSKRGKSIQMAKASAFASKRTPDFIALNGVIMACAKRGAGKTDPLINLLRLMINENAQNCFILVSLTYSNNTHMFKGLTLDANDVINRLIPQSTI